MEPKKPRPEQHDERRNCMKPNRVRVPWLLFTSAVGLVFLYLGLYLDSWSRSSWSNVSIALGAATFLLAIGIVLEPLMLHHLGRATEETATQAAESVVGDLRQRVIRLEDLDEQQSARRANRTDQIESLLAELHSDISIETVGRALKKAHDYGLFNDDYFCVRTGPDIQAPKLFFLPLVNQDSVALMWLSFFPMTERVAMSVGNDQLPVPAAREGTILWSPDIDAGEIAEQLEVELMRLNLPMASEFSLSYALDQLVKSIRIMFRSRMAASNSSLTLEGRMTTLINEDWVITERGLEATNAAIVLDAHDRRSDLATRECPSNTTQEKWDEAVQFSRRHHNEWLASIRFGR